MGTDTDMVTVTAKSPSASKRAISANQNVEILPKPKPTDESVADQCGRTPLFGFGDGLGSRVVGCTLV